MENLKFRAWDKFNGCYWYSNNYPQLALFFVSMQHLADGDNELIFEQFTGLLDKKGVEIYEGDICLIKFDVDDVEDYIYLAMKDRCGEKIFEVESPLYNNQPELNVHDIEVIGNIHQNKDLL